MNYGELKTLISGYAHRSDLEGNIPTFVTLATARIGRDVNDPSLTVRATYVADADDQFIILPADVRQITDVYMVTASGRLAVMPRTALQMSALYEQQNEEGAMVYCLRGAEMEVVPSLAAGSALEINYRSSLAQFVDDADTNSILSKYPNIYVYASMMELAPFIQGEERLAVWQGLYNEEVRRINEEAEDYEMSGAPLQIISLGGSTP